MSWQPIETAPVEPFNKERWFMAHSPRMLLTEGHGYVFIGSYHFTERGKGRWLNEGLNRNAFPTQWMPLPKAPEQSLPLPNPPAR